MFRDIIEGSIVGVILTIASYLFGQTMGWWDLQTAINDSPLWLGVEVAGVVLNYACVWLVARQAIASWPLGIIAVLFLGALFFHLGLYASMALSLAYFLPIQIWGWWNWLYGGEQKTELKVSFMKPVEYIYMAVAGVVAWYTILQVNLYFDATSAHLDVGILVLSFIAQYLLGLKRIESWFVWMAVNVLSIYVYGTAGAFLLAAQYVLFLANAGFGAACWTAAFKKNTAPVHFGR